jgi:DNA ligase (NAD+)
MDYIHKFQQFGVPFLQTLSKHDIEQILIKTNNAYRNHKPIISDNEFDTIEKYARENFPNMSFLNTIGADISPNKNKIQLPYFMPSMDKIKNNPNVLNKFKSKYNGSYVISDKLDGISAMYYCQQNKNPKLFTRGNGSVGQNISHLLNYVKGVPNINICDSNLVVRGELIVPKTRYQYYKNKYSNSRIMVSSIVNSKQFIKKEVSEIHFVSYEVIFPSIKPRQQMQFLSKHKSFKVVSNTIIQSSQLDNNLLSDLLIDRRKSSKYDIDGIIVMHDNIYPRKNQNPKHAFAFKMLLKDQQAETIVIGVEWNASKDGYLKPRINIQTTNIGGTNINYVTGINARFILDNKIGVGARVFISRSGDVIPKIEYVVEPATVIGLPPEGSYKWNDTGIDILVMDNNNHNIHNIQKKKIIFFFKHLNTPYIKEGIINKLYDAGYTTIKDYVNLKVDDIQILDGFQKKNSLKIKNAIQQSLKNASLVDLMAASNSFGRGLSKKRLQIIMDEYPDAFNINIPEQERIQGLLNVNGMGDILITQFIRNLPMYYQFSDQNHLPIPNIPKQKRKKYNNGIMNNIKVLFTGFRDSQLEKLIISNGGIISSNISKNIDILIAKNKNTGSVKLQKAKDLNIPILTPDEFIKIYKL